MANNTTISLKVNDKELEFSVGVEDFNNFQNDCTDQQTGMVAASRNFLVRTVTDETREALKDFLDNYPGSAMDICGHLVKEYKKPLTITVGK